MYPTSVPTLANQLTTAGLTWKGYMGDMGNDPARESATCGHPDIGTADKTQGATKTDGYATRHNGFMYFHSIIDSPSCATNVVALGFMRRPEVLGQSIDFLAWCLLGVPMMAIIFLGMYGWLRLQAPTNQPLYYSLMLRASR